MVIHFCRALQDYTMCFDIETSQNKPKLGIAEMDIGFLSTHNVLCISVATDIEAVCFLIVCNGHLDN